MSVQPVRQDSAMKVALVTFGKSGTRKEFPIRNGSTVIGRKIDAHLRIPLNEISRSHCELSVRGEEVLCRDLDSSNGTFLNGEQITEARLEAGDRLMLGPVVFTVQINGKPDVISPDGSGPKAKAPAAKAASDQPTEVVSKSPTSEDELDVDELDELNLDGADDGDLSDLDLDLGDIDNLEEIDDLEELDDNDVVQDDRAEA